MRPEGRTYIAHALSKAMSSFVCLLLFCMFAEKVTDFKIVTSQLWLPPTILFLYLLFSWIEEGNIRWMTDWNFFLLQPSLSFPQDFLTLSCRIWCQSYERKSVEKSLPYILTHKRRISYIFYKHVTIFLIKMIFSPYIDSIAPIYHLKDKLYFLILDTFCYIFPIQLIRSSTFMYIR